MLNIRVSLKLLTIKPLLVLSCWLILSSLAYAKDIQPIRFPIRLAFLPWIQLSGDKLTWINEMPEALFSEFNYKLDNIELIPPTKVRNFLKTINWEKESLLINQEITKLADQLPADFFLSGSIAKASNRYWILFRIMSGSSGQVITEKKLTVEGNKLEQKQVLKLIKQSFPALKASPVNIIDVGTRSDRGEIHIRSIPSHSFIALNGQTMGQTPIFLRHLPEDNYVLDIWESLPFKVKRIKITTSPGSANVFVNGKKLGLTPLEIKDDKIHVGEYKFEIIPNDSQQANQLTSTLIIETLPNDVPIQLNNSLVQRTNLRFPELSTPTFTLNILDNKQINVRQLFKIKNNQVKSLLIDLYKKPTLVVETSEDGAEIFIDNEAVGTTPFSSTISQGIHTMLIKKERFSTIKKQLTILPDENKQLYFNLDSSRSMDTSIAFVPSGRLRSGFNLTSRYLGVGVLQPKSTDFGEGVHLYGGELDYGWPKLFNTNDIFDIGIGVSAYYHGFQTERTLRNLYGVGTKVQFLREKGDKIPLSAAFGAYINADLNSPNFVAFLSLSKYFQDFSIAFGLQSHALNFNVTYTAIPRLKLSLLVYIDNPLLPLFGTSSLDLSPLYGLQAGYNF